MSGLRRLLFVLLWMTVSASAVSVQRFPPPEFENEYIIPTPVTPPPRSMTMEIVDTAVLAAALALGSWLALKKRSRKGIVLLSAACLAYFGFWRKGCICPIGAIGNVSLALFDADYAIPWTVTAFFFLPMIFTLFFGRSFCGSACPLGAVQDLVLLRPVRIPEWMEAPLRLLAWLYLSLAVLFAATASAFVICRYDPFVAFFRFSANPALWVMSFAMLVISILVGRPYCRFLCPYGVILRQIGRFSKFRVTITPDECIRCRLCENSCPFGAIDRPTVEWPRTEYARGRRRLLLFFGLLPVLIAGAAALGYAAGPKLAMTHPDVRLAKLVALEQSQAMKEPPDEIKAFRTTGQTAEALYREADRKQRQFAVGSTLVGGWMGLLAGVTLIQNSIFWRRSDYEARRSGCVACGRCFNACPPHRQWLKNKQDKTPGK
ncbi:MAG: 4Fe-4S binding protein [Planctomycetales bacterium]|nr:4Fe-4S binding protein [Planctomycetales bacterium]